MAAPISESVPPNGTQLYNQYVSMKNQLPSPAALVLFAAQKGTPIKFSDAKRICKTEAPSHPASLIKMGNGSIPKPASTPLIFYTNGPAKKSESTPWTKGQIALSAANDGGD